MTSQSSAPFSCLVGRQSKVRKCVRKLPGTLLPLAQLPQAWGRLTTLTVLLPLVAVALLVPGAGPHSDSWWGALRTPAGNHLEGLEKPAGAQEGKGQGLPRGIWVPSATALAWASARPRSLEMGLSPEQGVIWVRYTRFLGTILQVTRSGGKHRSRVISFIPVSTHLFARVPGRPQPGPCWLPLSPCLFQQPHLLLKG